MRLRILVLLLLVSLLAGCGTAKKLRVFLPPEWSGMREVVASGGLGGFYVDRAMSAQQVAMLRDAIVEARRRVVSVWGEPRSRPRLFVCASESCFRRLGGSSNTAHSLGGRILLSPRGLDAGMLAHEWSHAELYERSGGLLAFPAVPRWFDEGIAVLASRDARHGDAVWRKVAARGLAPPLASLASHAQWLDAVRRYRDPRCNPENLAVVYATAGHYVAQWYRRAGRVGLLAVVAAIRAGEGFDGAWCAAGTAHHASIGGACTVPAFPPVSASQGCDAISNGGESEENEGIGRSHFSIPSLKRPGTTDRYVHAGRRVSSLPGSVPPGPGRPIPGRL